MKNTGNKVLLIVVDGYGEGKAYKGNAVKNAKTPFIDSLKKKHLTTTLKASGNAVGLPKGYQGNSEVGHFTIGAGRIVWQSFEEINRSIKEGSFYKKKEFLESIKLVKKNKSKLHLMGMISDQGVHAFLGHLFELLKFAKKNKVKDIYIHAFMDGRDVAERSGAKFIKLLQNQLKKIGVGNFASIIGRFYAMDRDNNWKRTKKAYDLLTLGEGIEEKDPIQALNKQYPEVDTDYYIKPVIFNKDGLIENKDSVIFFNFRSDRAIQITKSFTEKNFKEFKQKKKVRPHFVCFGPYSKIAPVVFEPNKIKNNLGSYISDKNLHQLRIAETEKYAHVTFFFNSQVKKPYKNQKNVLVPSYKVASYDLKPEMSAKKICNTFIKETKNKDYSLVIINFANPDLVGHSGEYKAAVKGVETVDKCLSKIIPDAQKKGYDILITADHGNAEYMITEKTGESNPSHTTNPVLCILISDKHKKHRLCKRSGLQDIAPTILELLDIKKPKEMTGRSLIRYK